LKNGYIFNIIKAFSVTFYHLKASLLNKNAKFFQRKKKHLTDPKLLKISKWK